MSRLAVHSVLSWSLLRRPFLWVRKANKLPVKYLPQAVTKGKKLYNLKTKFSLSNMYTNSLLHSWRWRTREEWWLFSDTQWLGRRSSPPPSHDSALQTRQIRPTGCTCVLGFFGFCLCGCITHSCTCRGQRRIQHWYLPLWLSALFPGTGSLTTGRSSVKLDWLASEFAGSPVSAQTLGFRHLWQCPALYMAAGIQTPVPVSWDHIMLWTVSLALGPLLLYHSFVSVRLF